ncbi:MAG TPA: hypothetical protein VE569_06905 [Acidimicrobiia bacterium]|nr:hypothetical protein [Acidimicrobiia bacterium]
MRGSIEALREMAPAKIVVAVPVASPDICEEIEQLADETVCPATERPIGAVVVIDWAELGLAVQLAFSGLALLAGVMLYRMLSAARLAEVRAAVCDISTDGSGDLSRCTKIIFW